MTSAFINPDFTLQPTGSGPLDGLVFSVKDVIALAGHTNGLGNPTWAKLHQPAQTSAPVVAQLLAAGATLRGITVTDEFMFSIKGDNVHYGAPDNPLHPEAFSGGSSSGSASAVASGTVDFALGTDTGGSIRVPASYCGLFGIRPTHNVNNLTGIAPLAPSFDTVGWLAKTATVFAKVAAVLLPASTWQPTATIAPPSVGQQEALRASFQCLQGNQAWHVYGAWLTTHDAALGADIQAHFDAAQRFAHDATGITAATSHQKHWQQRLNTQLASAVMTLPTTSTPLPRTATLAVGERLRIQTQRLTSLAGLAGCPQVVIPTTTGSQSFIGPVHSDLALVRYALQQART